MGKQKQLVISRFFAPKPNPNPNSNSSSSPSPSFQNTNLNSPAPSSPSHRIAATVSWSPSKRKLLNSPERHVTPSTPSKKPKLSLPKSPLNPKPYSIPELNPSLHSRFTEKLLDDPVENGSLDKELPTEKQKLKFTPLEQQVIDLKSKYPDVLLMIEVGYKYRFFGEDAEIAARVLGIYAHRDHNFLTASIPTFRLHVHVRRLVNCGYKVGVVKQTETAVIKAHGDNKLGPFSRELSSLYTKATLEAVEDMGGGGEIGEDSTVANFLMCVVEKEKEAAGNNGGLDMTVGVLAVEVSTGEVIYGEFNDDVMRSGLEAVLLSISPAELLLGEPLSPQTEKLLLSFASPASNIRAERTSRACFADGEAFAEVVSLYENDGSYDVVLEGNSEKSARCLPLDSCIGIQAIMAMPELSVEALALVLHHLKQFGLEKILCTGASFQPLTNSVEMSLSSNTLQQLEVLQNNFDGSASGSLLQIMNRTATSFGARLFKHWVTHPLCDRNAILARLDAVSEIAQSMRACGVGHDSVHFDDSSLSNLPADFELSDLLASLLTTLGQSKDIQRGITRIFHRTATPSEFIAVLHSVLFAAKRLEQLDSGEDHLKLKAQKAVKSPLLRRLIATASSSDVTAAAAMLLSRLNKEAADNSDMENLFTVSNCEFPEVSRRRADVETSKLKLESLIRQYQKELGLGKLEFISVAGSTHLIELPVNVRVPSGWVKVSSTKKSIRYHSPEVLKALDELMLAKEELAVASKMAWDKFLVKFGSHYANFNAAIHSLAALDCLYSLASLSQSPNYVRPVFVDESEPNQIHILSGRHPVLESILQGSFVPNDTNLQADKEFCQIITGPNMGGKSCYIRQVALIAIMAQVGSFVPAVSAKLHVLDAIYTRMGASDSIQHGSSTFFEEVNEASEIMRKCTSHSLVIIDELGRGTSTHDGVAIAYATLSYLIRQKCMTLFVTHYPEITSIRDEFPSSVDTRHVSYLAANKFGGGKVESSAGSITSQKDRDITFLYKLVPGASDESFGLNVASLAQLPPSCIERASMMAAKLESEVLARCRSESPHEFLEAAPGKGKNGAYGGDCGMSQDSQHCPPSESSTTEFSDGKACEISKAYKQFFASLWSAYERNVDPVNSLVSIRNAQTVALEILS